MKTKAHRILSILIVGLLVVSLSPTALAASAYDRPQQKLVALTFDDGPGNYSDSILNTLNKHGAKATFFLNGYKVRKYSSQVRRMAAEGHQIGNHTYDHVFLSKSSDAKIRQQLTSTSQVLTEVTGLRGTGNTGFYLRPPYGAFNAHVASVAQVPVIWCTVDSGDWKYQNASRLVSYTGNVVKDGDIVVMHETHLSTAQGLDALLTVLESRGFQMVTVEDLFWRRGITAQPGKIYYSAKNTGVNRCEKSLWFDESRLNTHWAWPSIRSVRDRGILTGTTGGEFLPNFPLTRGMFVTGLGRMSGAELPAAPASVYSDLPSSHYAAGWASWAKENGLMNGVSATRFEPDRPITRQEMAVIMARYIRFMEINETGSASGSYSDQNRIAAWAAEDVALCTSLGLLKGSGGQFKPNDKATRAMGAAVLDRLDTFVKAHPKPVEPEPEPVPADEETEETEILPETDA